MSSRGPATIVIADSTGEYDGRSLEMRPLGGTESSVIRLARALAARGHNVQVFSNCPAAIEHEGVRWIPLRERAPDTCDLYVAVQHPNLLGLVRNPCRRAIWVLGQANHLKHYKQIWRMWLFRPVPILMSQHQVRIYSPFLPRREPEILLPLGLPDDIRGQPALAETPPPHAIFASNPTRNLRQLVEIWATQILPYCPDAVFNVYGVRDMPLGADAWALWEGSFLPVGVPDHVKASVRVHPPATRHQLIEVMRQSRVMLFLGHKVEAFCLAVAEAQALGVPAVVAPVAAVPERVVDTVTGFHAADTTAFAEKAVALLTDVELWRRQHEAALKLQQGISWSNYAAQFELSLLGDHGRPSS